MIAIARGRPLPRDRGGRHRRADDGDDPLHQVARRACSVSAPSLVDPRASKAASCGRGLGVAALWRCSRRRRSCRPGSGCGSAASPIAEQDETGSRQARKDLMWEGWQTFVDHPLTGVGAGQFKNYNPPDRLEPWRETHNVLLQIAAELGRLRAARVLSCSLAGRLGAAVDAADVRHVGNARRAHRPRSRRRCR